MDEFIVRRPSPRAVLKKLRAALNECRDSGNPNIALFVEEINYLLRCSKRFRSKDAQLRSVESRLERRL
jgi:hypothetical protein